MEAASSSSLFSVSLSGWRSSMKEGQKTIKAKDTWTERRGTRRLISVLFALSVITTLRSCNQLPISVCRAISVSSFKCSLKAFLFSNVFFSSPIAPRYARACVCVCVCVRVRACVRACVRVWRPRPRPRVH